MNNFNEGGESSTFKLEQHGFSGKSPKMCSLSELALNSYKTFTLADEDVKNLSVDELAKSLQRVRLSTEAVVKTSRSPSGAMRFLLHGDPEAIRKTEEAIQLTVPKKVTISFDIPTRARGIVVGKKGSRIRVIKKQYNVGITIEHKSLRRRTKIATYHKSDQLRLVQEDPYVAEKTQFNRSVKVTIEGTALGCNAAKASILEIAGNEVEQVFQIPSKMFIKKAKNMVKESFEAVSVTLIDDQHFKQFNLMVVQGPRAAVNAAIERFYSIDHSHVTIAIPTALKDRINDKYSSDTDIVSQESFNDDMEEWHEIWGEESVVLWTQQNIIEEISSYSKMRLTLADLHNGDIAHVRAILSLDKVRNEFDEWRWGGALAAYPDNTREKIQFIDFYGRDGEDIAKAVADLTTLIESVSPNDLFVIHDEELSGKLSMFTSSKTLKNLPDKSLRCRVLKDSLVIYREHEGKILHSESEDIDDAIMSGVEYIKRMVKSKTVVILEVPSMSQPILRVTHLYDITPEARISFYKNGLEDDKDKITLCGDHEPVARAKDCIMEILECEKRYPLYTQVMEMPSLFANVITDQHERGKYKLDFEINLHVSRMNGLSRQKTQHSIVSDMSLVTLTGNKFYVEASKKIIEEDLGKFLKQIFTLSTEIDELFLMRVMGRNFRHVKHLEQVHKVYIALPEEHPTYPYLFRASEGEDTWDQINISGASEKSILDARDELMRILVSKKKSTEKTTLRIPRKFGEFLRDLHKCERPGFCLGVDFIFHSREDEFVYIDILGCSPELEGAVEWIKYSVGQDTNEENEIN